MKRSLHKASEAPDVFVELLAAWFDTGAAAGGVFTLAQACTLGLGLDAEAMTQDVQARVAAALRALGCERVACPTPHPRFVYRRPRAARWRSTPATGAIPR